MKNTKVYPEWVQRHKERGTTIKKVGENYYLYKHSSKRVPGKKNPVISIFIMCFVKQPCRYLGSAEKRE